MEISVIEDKKNRFVFEIQGAGSTFLDVLKAELWNDKAVKTATYAIRHPIVAKPKFILETDGAEAKAVIAKAVERVKKTNEKLRKEFLRELK